MRVDVSRHWLVFIAVFVSRFLKADCAELLPRVCSSGDNGDCVFHADDESHDCCWCDHAGCGMAEWFAVGSHRGAARHYCRHPAYRETHFAAQRRNGKLDQRRKSVA